MRIYEVVLRRRNGRFIKAIPFTSKYAAKKALSKIKDKYQDTDFEFEILKRGK